MRSSTVASIGEGANADRLSGQERTRLASGDGRTKGPEKLTKVRARADWSRSLPRSIALRFDLAQWRAG